MCVSVEDLVVHLSNCPVAITTHGIDGWLIVALFNNKCIHIYTEFCYSNNVKVNNVCRSVKDVNR